MGLLIVVLAVVYYCAPDVEQAWKRITPGAVFAVLATLLVSLGFSLYVSYCGSYNKTYGSLGAVTVFLSWSIGPDCVCRWEARSRPGSGMPRQQAQR